MNYRVKSLLDAFKHGEVNVIAHQANCFNKMGAGIAPLIAAEWPQVREADNATTKGDHRKLGGFTKASTDNGLVYNLYGQYYPGSNTDYSALKQSMIAMRTQLVSLSGSVSIGLPKLGCGIGGGDWTIVSELIENLLDPFFDVTIYVLNESEIPKNNS